MSKRIYREGFVRVLCILVLSGLFCCLHVESAGAGCRDRSNQLRQDGSLCFEVPPWQHKPVILEDHLTKLKRTHHNYMLNRKSMPASTLVTSEINRYMETVLGPFLDTYHKNIQHAYQQLTFKILKKMKDEINAAVHRKQEIYDNLVKLAKSLNVPDFCDEERRLARTISSRHVALIYACTEDARMSISKMGTYAEEMITITKDHMQASLEDSTKIIASGHLIMNVSTCIQELSKSAVILGYELDLSLTNARRHNEQSCENLNNCCTKAKRQSDESVKMLKDNLQQCVYA